jgi:hypothetical protein
MVDRQPNDDCGMGTESFYHDLPALTMFSDVAQPDRYTDLPDDWQVAVSDVQGSTDAVAAGRYKEVNMLGASSIVGVLNAVKPLVVPYIFGGDGSSLCVPGSAFERCREAMQATMTMARSQYGLSLRCGLVPVRAIVGAGRRVRVAKCRTSANLVQAAFSGGGVQLAEQWIKDEQRGREFRLGESEGAAPGDYSGLECRWDNIPSGKGEIVTLLVQAIGDDPDRVGRTYHEVIDAIETIYGSAAPVEQRHMRLTGDGRQNDIEARLHTFGKGAFRRWWHRQRMKVDALAGNFVMTHNLKVAGVRWGQYKSEVVANSDFRKFDDLLRHVLSGDQRQREQLVAFLQPRFEQGELAFGLHCAPAALMTCLIFARTGEHVHFVDGANGGYTMASADLKQRLRSRPAASIIREGGPAPVEAL